jgi:hypothetical protein
VSSSEDDSGGISLGCHVCGDSFSSQLQLNAHVSYAHANHSLPATSGPPDDTPIFSCDYCQYQATGGDLWKIQICVALFFIMS